ncbi:MAG: ATP-dependent zinc metalloprotease FtsH [Oscillospiraceae bacterium]|nr:ATP-dependent zinc metalloprotease FtsH [Oscillospiraceae bacterium]
MPGGGLLLKLRRGFTIWLVLILGAYILYSFFAKSAADNAREILYSEFLHEMQLEEVNDIMVSDKSVEGVIGKEKVKAKIPSKELFFENAKDYIDDQVGRGMLKIDVKQQKFSWSNSIDIILSAVLILILIAVLFKRGGGGGFTKSRARLQSERGDVTFKDVAGAEEEKAELEEIVDFLKDPTKYTKLGAKIPRGILLVGSPGNGKTLLAKAIAGEAGVPFFSISGSDFVELYVGVGASRVRDMFEQAKRTKPCIVFIDEIDAVGRKRGAGMGGGHDEREQTLNQLLVEMDGFSANDGVIIIAATNRPDILDKALLRPGRFDRQIVVDYPDIRGREAVLKVHAAKKPLEKDVDLGKIAKTTTGYSGADLANLLNESAIIAAKKGHEKIANSDIEEANLKIMMGAEKRSRVLSPKEKKLTAYHEAGHAIAARIVDNDQSVTTVSIIPRGRAGGFTMYLPESDNRMYMSRKEMLDQIIVMLGGRVAEAVMLDDISTGASNDIQRATAFARDMVVKYGMSENVGPVSYDNGDEVFLGRDYGHSKNYSENTAAEIDEEVRSIITKQYKATEEIFKEYAPQLIRVAELLLEKETITGEEFENCFLGKKISAGE